MAENLDVRSQSISGRKKSVAEEPVTSVLSAGAIPIYSERELTADEECLAALGYKPEFKREFSLWTTFCVSFAVLGLLPSFASTLYYVRKRPVMRRLDIGLIKTTGHGIRRHTGNGLGMAHRHGLHPMRRHEHGRAVLFDAYKWGALLRFGGSGATGMGASRSLCVSQERGYLQEG